METEEPHQSASRLLSDSLKSRPLDSHTSNYTAAPKYSLIISQYPISKLYSMFCSRPIRCFNIPKQFSTPKLLNTLTDICTEPTFLPQNSSIDFSTAI